MWLKKKKSHFLDKYFKAEWFCVLLNIIMQNAEILSHVLIARG